MQNLKYLGWLVIAWGALDFGLYRLMEIDLWNDWLGFVPPEIIWKYSFMIAFAIGYGLIHLSKMGGEEAEAEAEEEA